MSLLDNLKVSGKLAVTTGTILVLLAIASIISVAGLTGAQSDFRAWRSLTQQTAGASLLETLMLESRLGVRDFILTGSTEAAGLVRDSTAEAAASTRQAEALFDAPEVKENVRRTAAQVESYAAAFDAIVPMQARRDELVAGMNGLGAEAEALIAAITVAERDKGNLDGLYDASEAVRHLLLARLYANRYLIQNEPGQADRVTAELAEMRSSVAAVDEVIFDPEGKAQVAKLSELAQAYGDAFASAVEVIGARNAVIADRLNPVGTALGEQMSAFKESNAAAQLALGSAAEDATRLATLAGAGAAIVALLLGILAAIFTGRGIAGPIQAMTATMRRLADGDAQAEIPARGRRDEIGQMAEAVQVFKDSMVRNAELAEAAKREQAAREARAQRIEDLTGGFDTAIAAVLAEVGIAAKEMQATAGSMSATAEETNRQAGAVAAASEQASANVRTVASAAEELSSSIGEIGRQVAQSAQIAGRASEDAQRTNLQVDGLAQAAQKIGEVVSLIQDIAEQTNLLALNATIEAARAGEAGKGFAVVASEVKNLANQTARATEQIGQQIGHVQSETDEAVAAIQRIAGTIAEIDEIAASIAAAVEEQGAATKEISRNVQEAARGTQEVSSNIAGVTRAAGDTGSAAERVNASADQLARQSEQLSRAVEGFLGEVRAA